MSNADRLELGSWNVVCWECGRKFKAVDLIKHWRGYYVCKGCFEPRHPQDFVRAVPDVQTPPWVQPRPSYTFTTIDTINNICAIPFQAAPGFVPGYFNDAFNANFS